MKVYTVYDIKADAYLQPFFAVSKGVALRQFIAAVQDESSNFCKFASDYTLFEIGEFDERSGKLSGKDAYESLSCAVEYLNYRQGLHLVEGEKNEAGTNNSDE